MRYQTPNQLPPKAGEKGSRFKGRLNAQASGKRGGWVIPTRWLNTVVGFFLLIPAWILSKTFFGSFSRAAVEQEFWATEEFWFFCYGAVLWGLAFAGSLWIYGRPRLLRLYVLGHEMTHGVWSFAMGGRVSEMKVGLEGGYVITDKLNVWIALAPYFHPIYSMLVIAGFSVAGLFWDIKDRVDVMFALLGVTWAFHLSFTCWMIPKGQSDLRQFGTFYSLVIIYLINLLLLCVLLVLSAPGISVKAFFGDLLGNLEEFSVLAGDVWVWVTEQIRIFWRATRA